MIDRAKVVRAVINKQGGVRLRENIKKNIYFFTLPKMRGGGAVQLESNVTLSLGANDVPGLLLALVLETPGM